MTVNWRDRIVFNPDILAGKPTIKGTRISVELILERFSAGWSRQDIYDSYPHITEEDLRAVFGFAVDVLRDNRSWKIAANK